MSDIEIDFHEGTLRLRGLKPDDWNRASNVPMQWDSRDDCYRCDAMFAAALADEIERLPAIRVVWRLGELRKKELLIPDKRGFKLRDDQLQAVAAFRQAGRGLIVMPTGTGKTVVAIELLIRIRRSCLIIVPVRDLMYQWHTKILESTGIDAGLIGDGIHRVSPISVTTYDSAAIHMHRIGDQFEFVIFDEVHHLAGAWRSDSARMSSAGLRLGLTATLPSDPTRLTILHTLIGPTIYQQSIAGAAGKTLASYQVRRMTVEMNTKEQTLYRECSQQIQSFVREQRDLDPSFRWEDIYQLTATAEDDPERASKATATLRAFRTKHKIEEQTEAKMRVLEDLFRLHAGEPVIVFVGSNVMARAISLRFMIPCLLSHCAKKERRELLSGFAEGRYPVLVANRVLDEGVDLPEVKTAIVLGGLSSQRQAIQRLGRVLRRSGKNQQATLYEVVTEDTKEVQRSRDRRRNETYRPSAKKVNQQDAT